MDIVQSEKGNGLGQVRRVQSNVQGPFTLKNNTEKEQRQYNFPSPWQPLQELA